jgi:hypothetical protein
MGMWYTTLEDVKGALDVAETARNNAQVRRVIDSGTRSVEGRLKRRFRPWTGTRTFSPISTRPAWQLPLGRYELIAATTVVSGGVTIAPAGYVLRPAAGNTDPDGPPYNQIDLADESAWSDDTTIAGVWGYRDDEETVGTLSSQLGAAATDVAAVSWTTARIGTGDVLRIGAERMVIRERTWSDSGQNLGAPGLTASMAGTTVAVTTGSAYAADEILLVDAEKMKVVDVAGNNLIVIRAWDGSVLAAHTAGADIYTLTGVQLDRGQLGTTAAIHSSAAVIYRHVVPGLVGELSLAEAVNTLEQELGAYGRTAGSGESAAGVGLFGLDTIRADAVKAYGRRVTWLGV